MVDLKLAKLPDRTPVKHAIVVTPELEQKLRAYADLYRQSYGEAEGIATLIPFMLEAFLDADRAFLKVWKTKSVTDSRKDDKRRTAKHSPIRTASERPISEK